MLLGSRPSWVKIFATVKLSAAVSRMRFNIVERSALMGVIGSSLRKADGRRLNSSETCRRRSEPPWLQKSAGPARVFGALACRREQPRPAGPADAYVVSRIARRRWPRIQQGLPVLARHQGLPSRYNS